MKVSAEVDPVFQLAVIVGSKLSPVPKAPPADAVEAASRMLFHKLQKNLGGPAIMSDLSSLMMLVQELRERVAVLEGGVG